jgi:hypothetical protein
MTGRRFEASTCTEHEGRGVVAERSMCAECWQREKRLDQLQHALYEACAEHYTTIPSVVGAAMVKLTEFYR